MSYSDTWMSLDIAISTLAKAQRHLSNRASCVRDGKLCCDGAPREAIDLMYGLMRMLKKEQRNLSRKRRKAA
jgi:hypothetical protein